MPILQMRNELFAQNHIVHMQNKESPFPTKLKLGVNKLMRGMLTIEFFVSIAYHPSKSNLEYCK